MNKKILCILLSLCFITSCNNFITSSSNLPIVVDSLETALNNTKYYALKSKASNNYTEIYFKNFYYNTYNFGGDIILDNDLSYAHEFKTEFIDINSSFDVKMNVYGRKKEAEKFIEHEDTNYISIFEKYVNTFEKIDDNTYYSVDSLLCRAVADFYESKLFRYANYIELKINDYGRIGSMQLYEKASTYEDLLCDAEILDINENDIYFYKDWHENGAKVYDRICDIKEIDDMGESLYEYENVQIDGYVSAKDGYGSIYLTSNENENNKIGIEVKGYNGKDIPIGQKVSVSGLVKSDNKVPHIENCTINVLDNNTSLIPSFSEETLVDSYGGGVYAANIFTSSSKYADSIYTTYAYIADIPEQLNESGDTTISFVCPNFVSNTKDFFTMDLIIPFGLNINLKTKYFNTLKKFGSYYDDNAKLVCLENVILKYNSKYKYKIGLYAYDETLIYERLNSLDKIIEYTGINNFPTYDYSKSMYYRFGEITETYLEQQYNVTMNENATSGLYVAIVDLSSEDFTNFYNKLEEIGIKKVNEINDGYTLRHQIYQKDDLIIDLCYMTSSDTGQYDVLNIWFYKGDIVHSKYIKESLNEKIGSWFNVDNFLILTDTYDADYSLFQLKEYASISFEDNSPLTCVCLDLKKDVVEDYKIALVKTLGYSQYRLENGKPYSYIARGKTHYVFTKDNVFIDVASYATNDYTYTGHDKFDYRIEILIYKRDKPLQIPNYDSLEPMSELIKKENPALAYDIELPSDAKIEIWHNIGDYLNVLYGYGVRDEAFIYTISIDEAISSIRKGLENAGYTFANEFPRSYLYAKTIDNINYYVLILNEKSKGYVRLMNSIGGLDFYK